MPRKLKVENLNEMPEPEGMTAVREEIQTESAPVVAEESAADEAPVAKPKAKGRAKKVVAEVKEEPVAEVKEEAVAEVKEEPVAEVKEEAVVEKVACPDCGKKVSAKTLKYSHKANCKALKQEQHHHSGICYQEDDHESRLQKLKRERRALKEARISQLAAQAF